jgi:hypothetical protein
MTVSAKSDSGLAGAGVTLIAIVAVVIMPWAMGFKLGQAGRVYPRIGPPDTIGVPVATGAGAGRGIGLMAGGAAFDIVAGGAPMIGQPGGRRVQQRNPILALMAADAEGLSVMTTGAVGFLALGLQPMRKGVIQIVDAAEVVIAPMTIETELLLTMASGAPVTIKGRLIAVGMTPPGRMDIGQGQLPAMAPGALAFGRGSIMAIKAKAHGRHMGKIRPGAAPDVIVAARTGCLFLDMRLVIEEDRSFGIR